MEVGGINVSPMSRNGNITQPLSDLGLQVDQRYNICVTAKNIIGHSSPGCNGSYIHMETEGTYIHIFQNCNTYMCIPSFFTESSTSASILVYAGSGGAALAVFILIVSCVLFGMHIYDVLYTCPWEQIESFMHVCSVIKLRLGKQYLCIVCKGSKNISIKC